MTPIVSSPCCWYRLRRKGATSPGGRAFELSASQQNGENSVTLRIDAAECVCFRGRPRLPRTVESQSVRLTLDGRDNKMHKIRALKLREARTSILHSAMDRLSHLPMYQAEARRVGWCRAPLTRRREEPSALRMFPLDRMLLGWTTGTVRARAVPVQVSLSFLSAGQ